jgi:hypothetical protein
MTMPHLLSLRRVRVGSEAGAHQGEANARPGPGIRLAPESIGRPWLQCVSGCDSEASWMVCACLRRKGESGLPISLLGCVGGRGGNFFFLCSWYRFGLLERHFLAPGRPRCLHRGGEQGSGCRLGCAVSCQKSRTRRSGKPPPVCAGRSPAEATHPPLPRRVSRWDGSHWSRLADLTRPALSRDEDLLDPEANTPTPDRRPI